MVQTLDNGEVLSLRVPHRDHMSGLQHFRAPHDPPLAVAHGRLHGRTNNPDGREGQHTVILPGAECYEER